ncbi:AMP-binding protein [Thaumasiovibrio sp. DFM-14]|uniref:AMP-binding protein n=1 Tax=Thaumasiovibrio sp. DFM-14 TaxID=3384792 RepID=UPI0039A10A74
MTQTLVCEQYMHWVDVKPDEVSLRQIINRQFKDFTYAEVLDQAKCLISFLRSQGVTAGDRVALISKNCAEWYITDLALMLGGYISVPIFPTAGADTISHILTHSESQLVIVGKLDSNDATHQSIQSLTHPITTLSFPYPDAYHCDFNWDDILSDYAPTDDITLPSPDDYMSFVYTSGTSGLPKGAMLTHGDFAWSSQQLIDHIGINTGERLFSYLPLAHITERVYILGTSMLGGVNTAFPESLDTFIEDVKMQRPTLFISVPRLWTLFQQRILDKLPQKKLNLLLKIPLVSTLVKKKLAQGLGLDQARVLGCGSAPVSPALLHWYHSVGLNITEAWGMTESFAYSTLNYPFRGDKIGTVGNAGPGVELRIADDEEVLVKSQGLFKGYYKQDSAHGECIVDGWLHTGDLGTLDNDGYLTIKGRKKDTFKTAKGKFVAPVPIEKRLFELSNIEMMCLIGSGLPAPILLAIPHAFPNFDPARYERKALRVLNQINSELESHAKIKGVLLIDDPWTIENGILTPTLKIKRHLLEKKYHDIGANWPKDRQVMWEKKR